jgi:hypothetical protein
MFVKFPTVIFQTNGGFCLELYGEFVREPVPPLIRSEW